MLILFTIYSLSMLSSSCYGCAFVVIIMCMTSTTAFWQDYNEWKWSVKCQPNMIMVEYSLQFTYICSIVDAYVYTVQQ